ncbi:Coatomer subunit beta'-2 isoform 1 [Theobroma cacao]|uniref:Beta'-coat protein n=2 Tax=Theobroma cacao TaxID=3641 RepID=A0A061GBE8_THECC|nr:Coatomer subunit beta'-2 isoform 1 [Theobroma cacao]
MALSLIIEKEFVQTSERVKSVDLHPTKPWILAALYSGNVCIWDYQLQKIEKSFKVTESPARSAKFIVRENWIVVGADDGFIRVYNYDTMEMIKEIEAHTDFIRSLAIHPTLPFILSSSDDKLIKLWDWEKGWICSRIFEGHGHYVMQVAFNPKDLNTFASASLDCTIKIWNMDSASPNFTLDAHAKGINCIEFFVAANKPYLISGSDDYTAKVWDYETKSCVQTLEGHTHNVTAICGHPELPNIITCSEDGTVGVWDTTSCRLEKTLEYGLERVWTVAYMKGSSKVVFGCDKGTIVAKISSSLGSDSAIV